MVETSARTVAGGAALSLTASIQSVTITLRLVSEAWTVGTMMPRSRAIWRWNVTVWSASNW
eukprot:82381-Chlamydomonas_euryale.AAC.2